MNQSTIASLYHHHAAGRQATLQTARECAALTKPPVLPPEGHSANSSLPRNYQSVGSRGAANLEGKVLTAMWSPGVPWLQLQVAPELKYAPDADQDQLEQIGDQLFMLELLLISLLESAPLKSKTNRRPHGFRSQQRQSISQTLITGDSLERIKDDYRIQVYRRDQYVTKRDNAGDVVFHIIEEEIDPLTLSAEQVVECELGTHAELAAKSYEDRAVKLYTRVEWSPIEKLWVIEQEVNKHVITTTEEAVSPFISTPFELVVGEDYGRGIVEMNLGDLRSLDESEIRWLDNLEIISKIVPLLDESSSVKEEDLSQRHGKAIRCRVVDGKAKDIGFLQAERLPDVSFLGQAIERKRGELSEAFLLSGGAVRDSERTTAYEVRNATIAELEGIFGGMYSTFADQKQLPVLRRIWHQAKRDGLIPNIDDSMVELRVLTGADALRREVDSEKLLTWANVVGALGPEAMAEVNTGVLMNALAQYKSIYIPNLIKSPEEKEAEAQARIRQEAQAAAASQVVQSAGNIAEAQLTGG